MVRDAARARVARDFLKKNSNGRAQQTADSSAFLADTEGHAATPPIRHPLQIANPSDKWPCFSPNCFGETA
jgi:hypothetical protein